MQITSTAFENNGFMPAKYTCDGENINPNLLFSDVPSDAASLALIMHDPDAPSGDWLHWTVWNISPENLGIMEDYVPEEAMQGVTDFGDIGYGGPCPHNGVHHYHFVLYALDTVLNLDPSAAMMDIEQAMDGHVLAKAELVGIYERVKGA